MTTKKIIIVSGLVISAAIIGFAVLKESKLSPEKEQERGGISFEGKQQIEAWVVKNNLNQYGDPKDTVYIGGTPLFDETTGESIDRYEYIIKNHPDKPWRK